MLLALGTKFTIYQQKVKLQIEQRFRRYRNQPIRNRVYCPGILQYLVTQRNLATANPAAYLSHLVSPAVFWQDYVTPKCKPLLDQTRPICYPSVPKRRLGKRNTTPGLLKAIQAPYCISFSSFLLASRSFVGPLGIQKASECKLNNVCHLYFTTAFA